MPNWCNNSADITHSDPARLQALADAINENKFCNFAIPVPQELRDTVAGWPGEAEREAHEAQVARNLEKFGFKDWYDFCVSRWGTKWEVDSYSPVTVEDNKISFGFDSAWAPPIGVYQALIEQGFEVDAMYYEPGVGFCGRWANGFDDEYTLDGMTAEQVAAEIDPAIDECFAISESMAEWEEENKVQEDLDDVELPPHTD